MNRVHRDIQLTVLTIVVYIEIVFLNLRILTQTAVERMRFPVYRGV